ncbi:Peroxidase 2 [Triticum urartu]|uniref:peroxidase n=1 Tax=Triticum urartu TaxID=4572 RepID=M7ZY77_TRIUA|nr:Peroxidase 2 [Triticum urartu]
MALLLALHGLLPPSAHAALQDGFYGASTNCTVDVEAVVRGVVEQHVSRLGDGGSGAGLIRLHFHDCFVKVPTASLPPPFARLDDLVRAFAAKGFGIDELVALSGAHSIGRAHCSSFRDRIHPAVHETMDPSYGTDMRARCPEDAGAEEWVAQDQATSGDLDGRYFENVLAGRVPFSSDRALIDDGETRRMVEDNAGDQGGWAAKFAAAMRKMSELAGTGEGEIREFCHVTNRG